jgi:hypothetical protein
MSTTPVTPDVQPQAAAPQAPTPEQAGIPAASPRLASTLGAIVSASTPALPAPPTPQTPSASSGGVVSGPNDDDDQSSGQRSGWKNALGKGLSVLSTGLSGVSDRGRPSFFGGLGEGSRAENAAQAQQQDIKFKDFDTQVRMANLHNQDLELQMRTQEQQDAHQKAQDTQADYDEEHGISYDPHPNDGKAVMDTLAGQTQANGAAEVPAGTHLSADGKTVNVPDNSSETTQGLLSKYKQLQGPLSLPALPQNAQFVPGRNLDVMTHKLGGFKADGSPWGHDDLPQQITALQSQRDALAKNGANPYQLATINNTIGIMQAQSDALDKHAATVKQQGKQAELDAENSPQSIAGAAKKAGAIANAELPAKQALQQNAQDVKPVKPQSTDWNPGVGADEKKKAELAENIAFNANEVAKIVMKRPDILGAVAGRYTNAEQMVGNNDPDISALGVHVHNMAMANSGVHGFRSQEGVESYERQLLNNFKNGPAAMAGALRASTGSVQTFIDNARPQTYKTHSNQGGAVKGMMGVQQ